MKMERQEARSAIISETEAAMADNDYLTISRIFVRLTGKHLDDVISDAITEALRNASDSGLAFAARFAVRSTEIREETEARMA